MFHQNDIKLYSLLYNYLSQYEPRFECQIERHERRLLKPLKVCRCRTCSLNGQIGMLAEEEEDKKTKHKKVQTKQSGETQPGCSCSYSVIIWH